MTITQATDAYGLRALIKQAVFDWLDLREESLKQLAYASSDELKLKYLAQIDFIETEKINIGEIISKAKIHHKAKEK